MSKLRRYMNRCCWFIFGQDKLPDNEKKLRKF